jgi:hypothetical protein
MRESRYMPARRLPELESEGHVFRGQPRICKAHGGAAVTWWIRTDEDQQLALL